MKQKCFISKTTQTFSSLHHQSMAESRHETNCWINSINKITSCNKDLLVNYSNHLFARISLFLYMSHAQAWTVILMELRINFPGLFYVLFHSILSCKVAVEGFFGGKHVRILQKDPPPHVGRGRGRPEGERGQGGPALIPRPLPLQPLSYALC